MNGYMSRMNDMCVGYVYMWVLGFQVFGSLEWPLLNFKNSIIENVEKFIKISDCILTLGIKS